MQIVIDIPEETYKEIKEGFYDKNTRKMAIAIGNGIQFPKGHGRIGDLDEILVKETYLALKEVYVNLKNYDFDTFGNYKMDINEAKKIINAVERLKLNGWILADQEHNPKENGFYIVTLDGEIASQEKPFVSIGKFENGIWLDDTSDYKCVLAWMPFPSPYKEEK